MKKIVIQWIHMSIALILLPISALDNPNSFKVRSGIFVPRSHLFREIYKTVSPCVELEYARKCKEHLEVWGNFDWLWRHGKSVGLCNPTKIKIANMSLGLKFPFQFKKHNELYFGVGPSISGVLLTNKSCCACEKISKPAGGIIVKSGYYYNFPKYLFLDIFADYLYQPVRFQHRTDIGGLKMGIGLGSRF